MTLDEWLCQDETKRALSFKQLSFQEQKNLVGSLYARIMDGVALGKPNPALSETLLQIANRICAFACQSDAIFLTELGQDVSYTTLLVKIVLAKPSDSLINKLCPLICCHTHILIWYDVHLQSLVQKALISFFKGQDRAVVTRYLKTFFAQKKIPDSFKFQLIESLDNSNVMLSEDLTGILYDANKDDGVLINFLSQSYSGHRSLYAFILRKFNSQRLIELHGHIRALDEQAYQISSRRMALLPVYYDELAHRMIDDVFKDALVLACSSMTEKDSIHLTKGLLKRLKDVQQHQKWLERAIAHTSNQLMFINILKEWFKKYHPSVQQLAECIKSVTRPDHFLLFYEQLYPLLNSSDLEGLMDYLFKDPDRNPLIVYVLTNSPSLPSDMISKLLNGLEDQSLLTLIELLIEKDALYQENRRLVLRHFAKRINETNHSALVNVRHESWAHDLSKLLLSDFECLELLNPKPSGWIYSSATVFHTPMFLNLLKTNEDFNAIVQRMIFIGVHEPSKLAILLQTWLPYQQEDIISRLFTELAKQLRHKKNTNELFCEALKERKTYETFTQHLALRKVNDDPLFSALLLSKINAPFNPSMKALDVSLIILNSTEKALASNWDKAKTWFHEQNRETKIQFITGCMTHITQQNSVYLSRQFMNWFLELKDWPELLASLPEKEQAWCALMITPAGFSDLLNNLDITLSDQWFLALPDNDYQRRWLEKKFTHRYADLALYMNSLKDLNDKSVLAFDGFLNKCSIDEKKRCLSEFTKMKEISNLFAIIPVINKYMIQLYKHLNGHNMDDVAFIEQWLMLLHQCLGTLSHVQNHQILITQSLMALMNVLVSEDPVWARIISKSKLLAEKIKSWLLKNEHLQELNHVLLHYPVDYFEKEVIQLPSFQHYVSTLILSAPPTITSNAFKMLWNSLHNKDERRQIAKKLLIAQPPNGILTSFDVIAADLPFDELYAFFKEQKAYERRLIARLLLHKDFAGIDYDRAEELLQVSAKHRLFQEIFDASTDIVNRQKLAAVLISHCHDESRLSSFLSFNDYLLFADLLVDKGAKTTLQNILSPTSLFIKILLQEFLKEPPFKKINHASFLYDELFSLLRHPYQGVFIHSGWIESISTDDLPVIFKAQHMGLNHFDRLDKLFKPFAISENVLEESLLAARWFHRLPLIAFGFLPLMALNPDGLLDLKTLADAWHSGFLDDNFYHALHTKLYSQLKAFLESGQLPETGFEVTNYYFKHFHLSLEALKHVPERTRAYALLHPEEYAGRWHLGRPVSLLEIERQFLVDESPKLFEDTRNAAVKQFMALLPLVDKMPPSLDLLEWMVRHVFFHPFFIEGQGDNLISCLRGLPRHMLTPLKTCLDVEECIAGNLKDNPLNVENLKKCKTTIDLIKLLSAANKEVLEAFDYLLRITPWAGLHSIIKLVQSYKINNWPSDKLPYLLAKDGFGATHDWFYLEQEITAFNTWLDSLPHQFLKIKASMACFDKLRPECIPVNPTILESLMTEPNLLRQALLTYQPLITEKAPIASIRLLIKVLLESKINTQLDDIMSVIWMNNLISCLLLYPENDIVYLSDYIEKTNAKDDIALKIKNAASSCTDNTKQFYFDLLVHQLNPVIGLSLPVKSPLIKAAFSYCYTHFEAPSEELYSFMQSFSYPLMVQWVSMDEWLKVANGEEILTWIRFYAFVLDSEQSLVDGFLRWYQLKRDDEAQKKLLRLILNKHCGDLLVLQCKRAKINIKWICDTMAGMPDRAIYIKHILALANWSWLEGYLMAHNDDFEILKAALNDETYLNDIFSSDEKQQGLFSRFVNGSFSVEQMSQLRQSVKNQSLKCLIDTYLLTRADFDEFFGKAYLISRLGDVSNYKPSSLNLILRNIPMSFLTPERLALMQPECAVALFCSPFHSQFWSKEHLSTLINKHPKPELIYYWMATQSMFKHSQHMLGLLWDLSEEHVIKALESTESKEKQSEMIATLINGWTPKKGTNKRLIALMNGQHLCTLLESHQREPKDAPVWDVITALLGELKSGRLSLTCSQWIFITKFISHEALSTQKSWLSEKILDNVLHRASIGDTDLSSLHHDYDISLMRTMLTLPAQIKPNESAFLTALRDSAKREKVDASIKLIDAHFVHYKGDQHALSPLLTHYLGFYEYGRSKTNVSAELLMTTGLLLRDDVSKPFQEALYEALLGFESLLKDNVLYHMYCYKHDDILKNLGDKKSYRVLIELNSLVSERLSGDDLKERRLPLQQASSDALFEERWSMLHVRFKGVREWFARCRHYGWHGFFKPNTSQYVRPYHEHIPQNPKKSVPSLASNRQKGTIDRLDEAIKHYQGIRATADEQRALGILILKACSLKENAHDLIPLRMRLDELFDQWLHSTSSIDDVLYVALKENRQEIIAYLYKKPDHDSIERYLSRVNHQSKKCPAVLDLYLQVNPGVDLSLSTANDVNRSAPTETSLFDYLNPLNYMPNIFSS